MSHPPRIASWIARGIASSLDTLFLNRFEAQRAEYWQTLHSSVNLGPFLILCSEDDDLVSYQIVCNYAQRLQELGGDVKLVKWDTSPHVAHYKYHRVEYKAAVTEFLTKVAVIYSRRRQLNKETTTNDGSCSKISESVSNPREAAVGSNKSLSIGSSDDFFLPSSMELNETGESDSSSDDQKTDLFQLPSINPHVCVPKNIEGWDIKPGMFLNWKQTFPSGRRHGSLNPVKFIRRSRL